MRLFRFNLGLTRAAGFSGQRWNRFQSLTLLGFVTFAALSLGGVMVSAQLETGQIAGTVTDQTGAAVPGAIVDVKNLSTNTVRNTVSSSTGAYLVPVLSPPLSGHCELQQLQAFVATVEVTVGGHATLVAMLSVSTLPLKSRWWAKAAR